MSDSKELVLVIGGTGKTGRRVVERLERQGVPVRPVSRSSDPRFDWHDPSTWAPVVEGVTSAYVTYYPDLAFEGAAADVRAFAEVAKAAGVQHLVLLSGRNEPGAVLGEEAVQESGVDWTIVRASFFAQDFSEHFLVDDVRNGVVAFPGGETGEPFIDVEDVADVVVAALGDPKHRGQLYEVTGPRLVTFAEAVAELSRATGRKIQYVPITAEEYGAAAIEAGMPPEEAEPFAEFLGEIFDGRSEYTADGVERALGRAPRDFADYARDAAASGVWDVTDGSEVSS